MSEGYPIDEMEIAPSRLLQQLVEIKVDKDAIRRGVERSEAPALVEYMRPREEDKRAWHEAFRLCGRLEEPK